MAAINLILSPQLKISFQNVLRHTVFFIQKHTAFTLAKRAGRV